MSQLSINLIENIIETANVIFVQLDNSGRVVIINKAGEEISGYKKAEIIGKNWFEVVVPKNRFPFVWEEFENIKKAGRVAETFENPILTKGGEERHIHWKNSTLNDTGKAIGTISIGIDITKRKQLENKLIESEKLLHTVLDNAPITIFATDLNGVFTLSEGKQLERVNLKPGENVGLSAFDIFGTLPFIEHSGKVITGLDVIRNVLKGESVSAISLLNGIYFNNNIVPILAEDGSVTGLIGVATDITDIKEAENKLFESEKHYRTLFNAIDEGFCIVEVIFDENEKPLDYRFLEINPSFERQTGLMDVKGKRMRELKPLHEEHWFEIYGRIAMTGKPERFQKHAEQLNRWYDVYAFRYDKPKNRQVAILFNDITERKKSEQKIMDSENRYRALFEYSVVSIWEEDFSEVKKFFDQLRKKRVKSFRSYFDKNPEKVAYCASLVKVVGINQTSLDFLKVKDKTDFVPDLLALFNEESIALFSEELVALAEGKKMFEVDSSIVISDGSLKKIHIRLQVQPCFYETLSKVIVSWIDISDRVNFQEALKRKNDELRELSNHLIEVSEAERIQIAHDLHDDLGQKLTALNMDISWLKTRIGGKFQEVDNKLSQMFLLLSDTIESVQKISYGLSPSILDDLGLYAAIESILSEFNQSTGLTYRVSFLPNEMIIDRKIALVIFRIVQEALTNVARHSGATKVTVKINARNENMEVIIKDNGSGIEQEKVISSKSYGLIGMRERITAIGGEFKISGIKARGTEIFIRIPLELNANNQG